MLKTLLFLVVGGLMTVFVGCTMFQAWKAIPPPGGCDQCHTLPISANWSVAYKPVALNDESGKLSFQTEQYTMKSSEKQGMSTLDLRKTEEQRCFECHHAPNQAHKGKAGRFHH
jgi:hypothetical protein